MTGVDYVREVFRYTGKGIKVGVVDTGIDYTNAALGGCLGEGCRVRVGHDFVGDDYDRTGVPTEDPDPIDQCHGHGTHVAGIVGADARDINAPVPFVGVAPDVTFGAYRIFSCVGTGRSDIIMKGMERAFDDGMDIINLSLGSGPAYRSSPLAALAETLAEKGVSVVAAAGNEGADGVWSVSNGGLGASTTSVGSFDNIAGYFHYFSYGGTVYPYIYSRGWGKPLDLPASATLIPALEKDGSLSDGCFESSYEGYNVTGKVALVSGAITRCKLDDRAAIAKTAGAAGMIIQSAPSGLKPIAGISGFPMASIEGHAGRDLLTAFRKSHTYTIQWSPVQNQFRIEGGATPSSFSSWGLDGDLHLKPDISGPGGNILSTFPQKMGSYAILSGTSMATPYVAGAHALLFEAHGKILRGQDVRQILMNTATPGRFFNHSEIAPVAKQGSGLINVKNAISAKTLFSPDKIELLDSVNFAGKSVEVTIRNNGDTTTDYLLSHEASECAISYRGGNTFPLVDPIIGNDKATVSFSQDSVTVLPGESVTIQVDFSEPTTGDPSEFPFYSGYIVATPQENDAISVRIPYVGVKGDVSKVPILDTDSGFPNLVARTRQSGATSPVEKGRLFDWSVEEPIINTRLGSHSPELSIRLLDVATDNLIGFLNTHLGIAAFASGRNRNLDPRTRKPVSMSYIWREGKVYTSRDATTTTAVPPGEYKVVVAARRKLSKGVYPADFEVYEVGVVRF
ncbi:peptidase S8/S53 domain-containing protein [Mortierella sp. GBAus27b]|nr:peptidase S8/S53 domain-containing protein [Mortierella sp. GBAus27b]